MAYGTCAACGEEGRIVRGWCNRHYLRWQRYGDPLGQAPRKPPPRECSVDDCDEPPFRKAQCQRHYRDALAAAKDGCSECGDPVVARGLCGLHYDRWRKSQAAPCSINGCDTSASRRDWCTKHYAMWRVHGDPLYVRPKTAPDGFKRCNSCSEIKPVEAFHAKPYGDRRKRTRASRCKECLNAEQSQRRRERADEINERERAKYARNPSRKRASKAAYWQRNREVILVRQRAKYRRVASERPEQYRAANARRKQRLKVRMDKTDKALSVAYRMAIRDDPCFYCGCRIPGDMHDEHFFPLAKGGTDHWWNLVRSCGPCNRRKHAYCGTWFLLKTVALAAA